MKKTLLVTILISIFLTIGYLIAELSLQNYKEEIQTQQIQQEFKKQEELEVIRNTPTPTNTITHTITITPTILPTTTPVPTLAEPANNNAPKIDFLSYGIKDNYEEGDPVRVSYRASDSDGTINRVEIYLNNELKQNIYYMPYGGKDEEDGFDIDKQFDITKESAEYVEQKTEDRVEYYISRMHRNWETNDPFTNCDIKKGYINYHIGEKNYYITKSTSSGNKHQICYQGKSVNMDNLYYHMFTNLNEDSYKIYAIAYDNYNRSTKSETYEFEIK